MRDNQSITPHHLPSHGKFLWLNKGAFRMSGVISGAKWAINSAVECHLHTVEVTGSIPVSPTILLFLLFLALPANAAHRSAAVLRQFQATNPCPSTGKTTGACPGWVKDHRTPLCAGGADSVVNLQWMTVKDAKAKDKLERKECRK